MAKGFSMPDPRSQKKKSPGDIGNNRYAKDKPELRRKIYSWEKDSEAKTTSN